MARPKKVIEPIEPIEEVEPAPSAPMPEVKAFKQTAMVFCVNSPLWHPFQKRMIPTEPVEVFVDGWIVSQMKAGLIKEV